MKTSKTHNLTNLVFFFNIIISFRELYKSESTTIGNIEIKE